MLKLSINTNIKLKLLTMTATPKTGKNKTWISMYRTYTSNLNTVLNHTDNNIIALNQIQISFLKFKLKILKL